MYVQKLYSVTVVAKLQSVEFSLIKNNILISCMDIKKTLLSSVLKKPVVVKVQRSKMRRQWYQFATLPKHCKR